MKNSKRCSSFLFILIVSCFSGTLQAQHATVEAIQSSTQVIDSMFIRFARAQHFPGVSYGLIAGGKLIHTGNYGFINVEKKLAASSSAAFRIASMSKSFTAMAVLKLRDMGKLRLDDPVYKYIPEMKDQKYLTKDAAPVTVRNLMSHEAGFPEDNPWGDRQLAVPDATLEKMIKEGISYSNDPGIDYEYSNLGFAMLGLIIKNVSGTTYQDFISKNIWKPLGMNDTYWEYAEVPASRLALGYRWINDHWVEQPILHDGAYGAMGGMITTIEDFSKYVLFHLSAWPPSDKDESGPVTRNAVREMQHPHSVPDMNASYHYPSGRACPMLSAYSFGLRYTKDCEGRVSVGHAGGLPGYGSQWTILPQYGIGIISFSNATYAAAGYINTAVLDSIISLVKLKPNAIPVSSILKQRQGELVKLLPYWTDAAASGIFAENFFMDYFTEELKAQATEIYKSIGNIVKVHEMMPENNLRGSFIIEGTTGSCQVSFTLTPEKNPLIQEYDIELLK